MKLIGMLDSPYVRRVAISLQLLGLRFEHQSLSVFRTFDQFQQINPVVKAPTFVCDDGEVLMDSTLILQYAEARARPRSLMPAALPELQHTLRVIGLALAACEKSAQILYEGWLRPPEKLHEPWVARVTGQLLAAFGALEEEVTRRPLAVTSSTINQAGVCAAVAWHFTQQMLPQVVPADRFPALVALSAQAEALPEFKAAPHGDSTYGANAGESGQAQQGTSSRLLSAIPKLASLDIARSLAFFETLGFARRATYPDYGIVERDGAQLHFWLCQDARIPKETACRIAVEGIEQLFEMYSAKGVIHPNGSLALKPWGVWEFSILDPDGNLVTFQQQPGV